MPDPSGRADKFEYQRVHCADQAIPRRVTIDAAIDADRGAVASDAAASRMKRIKQEHKVALINNRLGRCSAHNCH